MSTFLHLDLLKDEERFSSSPIRLRVMLPLIAMLATLCCLLWWGLCSLRTHNQADLKERLEKSIREEKTAHAVVLDLRLQEKETSSVIRHLQLYEHARLRFGASLLQLSEHIPANIQLTELRLSPSQPLFDPQRPALGPTNTFEQVTLRLAGRTGGDHASASVNTLLASLLTPAFTNIIETADIPKGAFRQEAGRGADDRDTLVFEIRCSCRPRRFE
jgi:Tfp pilus assembly protein PilN